jgi:AraC family L-rhamnose operon transcriptional activator RhaR/AraC family L-rhamnose operon regulatory protein RhaS
MVRVLKREDWFHADGFPIAVENRDPQEPFGLHAHEFSEIVIITGGTGLHVTGEDSWQLASGDAFVIGGSRPHDYHNMERLRLINVLYDQERLSLESQDLLSLPGYHALFHLEPSWRKRHQFTSHLRLSPRDLTVAVDLANHLHAELKGRAAGYRCMATALFTQLVVHLSRCYSQSRNENSKALLRIAETITYLETHFHEDVKLETLIEIAEMPRRSFLRAFESATGCSPIAYMIQLRMNRAADLLRRTEDGITDIAFAVGFNDSNYFSRQFRKHLGLPPREYRLRSITAGER